MSRDTKNAIEMIKRDIERYEREGNTRMVKMLRRSLAQLERK